MYIFIYVYIYIYNLHYSMYEIVMFKGDDTHRKARRVTRCLSND